jgi:competence protein ComFC
MWKIASALLSWLMPARHLKSLPIPRPELVGGKHKAVTLFHYRDTNVKRTIWALKYRGDRRAVDMVAEALHDVLIAELAENALWRKFETPLLVPIPLSKKRFRKRGFNQCELVAEALARKGSEQNFIFRPNVLYKIKDTINQADIKDKKTREQNLAGCFSVKDKKSIAGENIILLDDVTTTGSTLREAKKTLLRAGARRVFCIAIAH